MSNILLSFDPLSETKKVTKTSNGCATTCELVTETFAPLDCKEGEKIILFFKNPDVLIPSADGVLVGDIIYRRLEAGKYVYYVYYDDALLAPGVLPDTLSQCDVLKACCYDCAALYVDTVVEQLSEPFILSADVGVDQNINHGDTLTIAGGIAAGTTVSDVDTVTVDVQVSGDANNAIVLGGDGGLYAAGGGGGIVDCTDTLNCINVAGLITGTGTPGDPFSVIISTDAGNRAVVGTDTGVFVPPVGTDALAFIALNAAGGNTLRHTALNGTQYNFAEGFATVRQSAACAAAGVNAAKMVRAITLVGTELVVDAAPEHSSLALGFIHNGSPGTDISPVATYQAGPSGAFVINNPSLCREFRGVLTIDYSVAVALQITGVWRYTGQLSIDAAPYADITQSQWGVYPGLTGTNWFALAKIPFTIAAGGSIQFNVDHKIETLVASAAGSVWNQFITALSIVGSTAS